MSRSRRGWYSCRASTSALAGTLLFIAACSEPAEHAQQNAVSRTAPDAIYYNAAIYTVDDDAPWAEAMAISDGRIIATGSNADVLSSAGSATLRIDLGGRMVMPGIQDMHLHPLDGGIKSLYECNFGADADVAQIVAAVKACAAGIPEGTWILGGQWGTHILEQPPFATRQLLDEATASHPVFLLDFSVHNAWLNTRALDALGLNRDTVNPTGGEHVRDRNTGELTGILLDNAAYNARKALPPYSLEQRKAALSYTMEALASFGVTSFRDAITPQSTLDAYNALEAEGAINARVKVSIPWKSAWSPSHEEEQRNIARHSELGSAHIDAAFAKIMLDGVPLTYTSAVLEPYAPSAQYGDAHYGELMIEPAVLAEDVTQLDAAGMTIKMHATGDRAVRVALDAVEAARKANGASGLRHEISHAEMIHPDDFSRFAELNVAAEMCPILWYPSVAIDSIKMTLGEERGEKMWPVRTLVERGALVFYGSDWPAVVPDTNPWPGIEAMVTRKDPYGVRTDTALWPEQAVDLATAIRIFTLNGAVAGKQDDTTGSLVTGKYADFIVLSQNIFEVPPEAIGDTRVEQTYIGGQLVHATSNLAAGQPTAHSR